MSRVFFFLKRPFHSIVILFLLFHVTFVNASTNNSGLPDFVGLFEVASPAVVNISTLVKPKAWQSIYGFSGEELPEIFRRYFIPSPDESTSGRSQPMSLGSGFIISADGYILTNNHVIDGADQIIVRLSDRSELPAELVGSDKRSDLALLKIRSDRNLPVVKLGNSEDIKPGQWVAAIGSPFNFEYSITKGIVSALNRSLPGDSYVPFIQTDVPVNPGNSGGPLFNMNGEVVGINSQILTRSGGFMGLSFAIPVDHVMWVVDQLKDKGYVTRGWLGVAVQDVDRDLAESFGLEKPVGALVSQVVPGGPADKAGLHPGDIIVRFNERAISSSGVLPMSVGVIKPGEKVKLEYIRYGKRKTVDVNVGQLPDENGIAVERRRDKNVFDKNPLGVQVADLDENYRGKLRLNEDIQGVVVIGVSRGAERSVGLRQGDVITDLDNRSVATVAEFQKVIARLPKKRSISMRVIRGGYPAYITFRLQE